MHAGLLMLALVLAGESGGDAVDYQRDVKAVLKERCFACHGALKQEAGLRLDAAAFILKGGDSGPAVIAKSPADSELMARVSTNDDALRMPPEGHPLSREQIERLRQWIQNGALAPDDDAPEDDPRQHWAFQPPQRPDRLDGDADTAANANPIDRLLSEEHRRLGLRPLPLADEAAQLRRVFLDLTGLPPTRAQLVAFLEDRHEEKWGLVVEQLLASPAYGERWGRHWMDVWRYADWAGLGQQLRYSQKHIWHWRDWIVESLNDDKGYDRMILEMLAADEIAPTDIETLRASGFLARNYFLFNRTTWLDATIEHTSKAFLGLTMNCCKCHDHKYDPLLQIDYYRMRAIFEPHQVRLDSLPGTIDLEQDGLPRVYDAHPEQPTYLHIRGNDQDPDTNREIAPGVPRVLQFDDYSPQQVTLPGDGHQPALRPFVLRDYLDDATRTIEAARVRQHESAARLAKLSAVAIADESKSEPEPATIKAFANEQFDAARPDVWEQGDGDWEFDNGVLRQNATGATRKRLSMKANHPSNFEATLRFRTLRGDQWKSVGVCFDVNGEREKLVYLSAVQPGSKLQISWKTGASHTYPQDGMVTRPVELNQWYDLQIRVRDAVINVAIDGRHVLAFRLPLAREVGRFELIAFDAAVEFDSFVARPLAATEPMIEPGGTAPPSLAILKLEAAAADAQLAAAELRPAMLRSAFEADRAKLTRSESGNLSQLVADAALAARRFEVATNAATLADAELKLASADDKTRDALTKARDQARQNHAAAEAAVAKPGDTYPSLQASLKALEGPDETDASRRLPFPAISTGRRTAFAEWIIDRRNPLTARVAVNHIWMRHFGEPLVDPVTDFGLRAKQPPLQKVLDWLAVELMENNWSMKHVHRLIVTSRAYRITSSIDAEDSSSLALERANSAIDAGNHFVWKRRPLRVESQVVRDSLLMAAGQLDQKLGGPTIPVNDQSSRRRSLYFNISRAGTNEFVSTFDDADVLQCYRRSESIVPQQALALANSRLPLEMARLLAQRLSQELEQRIPDAPTEVLDRAFVDDAFQTVLSREATPEEVVECLSTLRDVAGRLVKQPDAVLRARSVIVQALFNHNDFVTIR